MNFIRFDQPALLWLLLLIGPIVWLGLLSLNTLDPVRRWTAIGIRVGVLIVLVLMLAGLQAVQRHTDLTVIAVVDDSESVRRFAQPPAPEDDAEPPSSSRNAQQWTRDYLRAAANGRRGDDKLGLVTYDGRPTVRVMPRTAVDLDSGSADAPQQGTDTASAIRSAMALFPPDSGARLVLVSDGNDTASPSNPGSGASAGGDVLAAAREAAAAGIPIDVLPVSYNVENEVMVDGVYAPTEAREGQTLAVRVVLRATQPAGGTLQILQDGEVVDFSPSDSGVGVPIREAEWSDRPEDELTAEPQGSGSLSEGGQYVLAKQVELPTGAAGPTRFEAIFEPDRSAAAGSSGAVRSTDTMAGNNRAEAFTLVSGRGQVLVVDNIGGESGMILPNALAEQGVPVSVVNPNGLPNRMSQLQKYDAVVFQNVPAELVPGPQQRMLARYVHDLGGGFVMLGGDQSFGAGGWTNSPIDEYVLPVTCQIPSQTVLPSGALAIVLDRSGSMFSTVGGTNKTQIELAAEAAVLAHSTLYPQDVVSVIAFDSQAYSILEPQPNQNPQQTIDAIRSIQPGGGTNVYSGLEMAYDKLSKLNMQDAAVRHVLLVTDGQTTGPPPGGYIRLMGQMAQEGITLSTVGVGNMRNDPLLQRLANQGTGQYHPITNPSSLPQIFIKEARTIRKNLIREETFTPTLRNTGSPIMTGVGAVPPLRGLVLTGARNDPRVFTPILGPEGEPVFAHWQVGLGRSAAFTSDATNKWAAPWLNWGGYADFWSRTIRQIARPTASRSADLLATVRGDRLHLKLDAAGGLSPESADRAIGSGSEGFANFLQVQGAVVRPDGETENVTLEQTGPGVYEATVPATDAGNYITSLIVQGQDGQRRTVFGGASRRPGDELRTFASNDNLMREVAQVTGGRVLEPTQPQAAGLFTRDRVFESRSIRPMWRTLLVILLVLFLLDVANRRIAWDLGASWGWLKAHASRIFTGHRRRDSDSEGTLSAWKKVRTGAAANRQADSANQPRSGQPAAAMASAAAPAPSAKRKFEADPAAAASDDFASAVGGARANENATAAAIKARRQQRAAAGDTEDGSTTSQLLGAKRRARDQYKNDES